MRILHDLILNFDSESVLTELQLLTLNGEIERNVS